MQNNPQDERPDETTPAPQDRQAPGGQPPGTDAPDVGTPGSETPGIKPDYDDAGVPSFDYVRDRIEQRAATAIGWSELPEQASTTAELDKKLAEREKAGQERLEQIRRSMRGDA